MAAASILTVSNNNADTFAGTLTGNLALTKDGSGILTLSGANDYSGDTLIYAGTLQLGAAEATSANSAIILADVVGATFDLNGNDTTISSLSGGGSLGGNVTLGTGTLTVNGNTDATFNGVISGTGGLTKLGSGNLTLDNVNLYTGATNIEMGTLTFGVSDAISPSSDLVLAAGATLGLGNFDYTIAALSGAGNLAMGNGTLTVGDSTSTTYDGIISGSGNLVKEGNGTLTLANNNTYTGTTDITDGTLQLGASNALAYGNDITIASGATLDLNNFSTTAGSLAGAGNVSLGNGTLTLSSNANSTLSGNIIGSGNITNLGTGIFTVTGNNTSYSGTTTIANGTLDVGNNNALGTGCTYCQWQHTRS